MTYAPAPVNQFNRLVRVSGAQPTGTYVLGLPWNNIHNGQDYDNRNCTPSIGAVIVDAGSGGHIKSSPNAIRNHQNDWAGGIGWDDVDVAITDLYGSSYAPSLPYSADWNDVIHALTERRYVGVQGDYDQVPYDYQCQKGGTFDHAFGLGGYRPSDGRVLYYDPLCRHAQWVPQRVIRPAAEKLALAQRGTRGRLFVAFSRPMPTTVPPTPTWRAEVHPTSGRFWVYRLAAGQIVGREIAKTGGFSADATAPKAYWWKGVGTYHLVQIVGGSRDKQWIQANYAEEK